MSDATRHYLAKRALIYAQCQARTQSGPYRNALRLEIERIADMLIG